MADFGDWGGGGGDWGGGDVAPSGKDKKKKKKSSKSREHSPTDFNFGAPAPDDFGAPFDFGGAAPPAASQVQPPPMPAHGGDPFSTSSAADSWGGAGGGGGTGPQDELDIAKPAAAPHAPSSSIDNALTFAKHGMGMGGSLDHGMGMGTGHDFSGGLDRGMGGGFVTHPDIHPDNLALGGGPGGHGDGLPDFGGGHSMQPGLAHHSMVDVSKHLERGMGHLAMWDKVLPPTGAREHMRYNMGKRDHLEEPQKFDPFASMRRHWGSSEVEEAYPLLPPVMAAANASEAQQATKQSAHQHSLDAYLHELTHHSTKLFAAPGVVDGRAQSSGQNLKILSRPAGGKLGLTVTDLVVAAILEPRALDDGWAIGDRILQVNNVGVSTTQEFTTELARAISEHNHLHNPLTIDIWRPSSPPRAPPPSGPLCPSHAHAGSVESLGSTAVLAGAGLEPQGAAEGSTGHFPGGPAGLVPRSRAGAPRPAVRRQASLLSAADSAGYMPATAGGSAVRHPGFAQAGSLASVSEAGHRAVVLQEAAAGGIRQQLQPQAQAVASAQQPLRPAATYGGSMHMQGALTASGASAEARVPYSHGPVMHQPSMGPYSGGAAMAHPAVRIPMTAPVPSSQGHGYGGGQLALAGQAW